MRSSQYVEPESFPYSFLRLSDHVQIRKVLQIRDKIMSGSALLLSISVSLPGVKTSPSAQTSSFTGSFFLVSALMINVLRLHPFNGGRLVLGTFTTDDFSSPFFSEAYNKSLSVVASTTFLTGIIQVGSDSPNP